MIGPRLSNNPAGPELENQEDRRKVERRLAFERAKLRAILENVDQGFALVDEHQRLVAMNQRMIDQFGYPEHLSKENTPVADLFRYQVERGEHEDIPGTAAEKVTHLLRDLVAPTEPATTERTRQDGTILEIWTKPLPQGGVVRTFTDITKRKQAEQALLSSERRLVRILNQSPVSVIITGVDGSIVFANEAEARQLKLDPSDVIGLYAPDLYVDPRQREVLIEKLQNDGAVRDELTQIRRPDGTTYWGLISMSPIRYENEDAVLVWSYDVTHLKQVEDSLRAEKERSENALVELRQAQENLIRSEKMSSLGSLTAGIAHEIKNPLNFINNFAETSVELLDELRETLAPAIAPLSETARRDIDDLIQDLVDDLQTITSHGRRADGIVRTMLLLARGTGSERVHCDLNALVDESLKLAFHGERARDRNFNVSIEQDLDPKVGQLEIAQQEISRVLINLFSNAFDATRKRGHGTDGAGYAPKIAVSTRQSGAGVEIRIHDNGSGIAAENIDKVFTPFFTTKPTGEGTGLGLSLSHDIVVQQHGGALEVVSEEGAYTEFILRLPGTGTC